MKLSDQDIIQQLNHGHIGIDPMPDEADITGLSVDLHLSNRFRVFQGHRMGAIDLSGDRSAIHESLQKVMSDEIIIDHNDRFYLHPGELALGATLETITIPNDLVGWIDGRSSLARLGLMVHVTAHRIDPGWHGQIVLEFFNSGKLPLALAPNMNICALFFEPLTSPSLTPYNLKKGAKYKNQQGPIASRINNDA